MFDDIDHRFHNRGIELSFPMQHELLECVRGRKRQAVGSPPHHRVERVHNADDTDHQRYRIRAQAIRVTLSVEAFVVPTDGRLENLKLRDLRDEG